MKVLLFDSSALCHRARHSMKGSGLSFNELKTDIIYSFLSQVLTICEELESYKAVFVWDSKINFRKDKYDFYKNRPPVDDEEMIEINKAVLPQMARIRKQVLPALGFKNVYISTGFEADDLICSITRNNYSRFEFVIVSRDHDLFQLLNDKVSMYDFQTKKFYTDEWFKAQWGIDPIVWGYAKAIAGCTSDTVPGVPGVKEKTACKYLTKALKETYKTYKAITDNKELIERNKPIVILPYKGTPKVFIRDSWEYDYRDFYALFERFGMKSFMDYETMNRWQSTFNLLE